ncbi:Vmc-like lipoprotein signal peptide domain-containing protein [Ureaplasma canigenitalium]|uniref:Vmc-like lipoprotein signal peptide domain-containing protein n=1 Tax=Ureaplasma canigenitalium TaxID=42092 RepID=UPI0004E1DB79|nr:hypothetical protein [Ureaplasma canigenitalium]
MKTKIKKIGLSLLGIGFVASTIGIVAVACNNKDTTNLAKNVINGLGVKGLSILGNVDKNTYAVKLYLSKKLEKAEDLTVYLSEGKTGIVKINKDEDHPTIYFRDLEENKEYAIEKVVYKNIELDISAIALIRFKTNNTASEDKKELPGVDEKTEKPEQGKTEDAKANDQSKQKGDEGKTESKPKEKEIIDALTLTPAPVPLPNKNENPHLLASVKLFTNTDTSTNLKNIEFDTPKGTPNWLTIKIPKNTTTLNSKELDDKSFFSLKLDYQISLLDTTTSLITELPEFQNLSVYKAFTKRDITVRGLLVSFNFDLNYDANELLTVLGKYKGNANLVPVIEVFSLSQREENVYQKEDFKYRENGQVGILKKDEKPRKTDKYDGKKHNLVYRFNQDSSKLNGQANKGTYKILENGKPYSTNSLVIKFTQVEKNQ